MKKLDDKYSYSCDDNGVLHLYRNGEKCDNLISNPLISAIYKIEELENDSNDKLVHVSCQYVKCFKLLKTLLQDCYSIAECEDTNLGFWEDDLKSAEEFIKENE